MLPPITHPQGIQLPSLENTQANIPHDFTHWPEINLSDPAPLMIYNPLKTQPAPEAHRGIDAGVVFTTLSHIPGGWNGWPSGLFAMDVSPEEFNQTKRLQINWATRFNGGDSSGLETASTIAGGEITNRQCLGVVWCENPQCKVICRPGTTPAIRDRQLHNPCRCGFELNHFECPSRSFLIQWSGRYRYVNGMPHNHSRLSYVLHMTRSEEHEFKELVETHPHLGPVALMLGPRRLDGYGKGAADISEATRHPDRVKYERRMVKSRTMAESGHWFLSQFSEWQRKHPGVVRTYQNTSEIMVISIQMTWMRDMLVPEIQAQSDIDDALNGLLSDAAHGYWSVGHYLLIVTSVFSDVLAFWVPGLFTVSNGATAEHYRYHFKGVLESIAEVAEAKDISVYDEMFAGVRHNKSLLKLMTDPFMSSGRRLQ